jgi:hypothetical protein
MQSDELWNISNAVLKIVFVISNNYEADLSPQMMKTTKLLQ